MIFGIGLPKTGNTSLFAALRQLGYRAGSYPQLRDLGLNDWFRGHFRTNYLDGYEAVTDGPLAVYYPQLDRYYPNSKFVLSVRDVDSWLESARKHYGRIAEPVHGFRRDVRLAMFGITSFDPERFRYVYQCHIQNTVTYFQHRPQALLTLNIVGGEGWDKLCTFLDREVPKTPFPDVQPWQLWTTDISIDSSPPRITRSSSERNSP